MCTLTTLSELTDYDDEVGAMDTSLIVGTPETDIWDGRMIAPLGYESRYDC
jgi:precorrin-3B C17-methyltransferase